MKIILMMTNYAKNYASDKNANAYRLLFLPPSSIVHRLESFVWGLDVTETENGEWETSAANGKMKNGKKT